MTPITNPMFRCRTLLTVLGPDEVVVEYGPGATLHGYRCWIAGHLLRGHLMIGGRVTRDPRFRLQLTAEARSELVAAGVVVR